MRWRTRSPIKKGWHTWFAWYPVELENGEKVWLEQIVRRARYHPADKDGLLVGLLCRLLFTIDYEYRESLLDLLRDGE